MMEAPFDLSDFRQAVLHAADDLIAVALAEDWGERGDITTQAISRGNFENKIKKVGAGIIAKSAGVVCGIDLVAQVFRRICPPVEVKPRVADGEWVEPKKPIARLFGPAISILACERVALNFLQRLSGIATLTQEFVEAVALTKAKILDTRKTTPGWRLLEKYAVHCGGGSNHRFGLDDMFLIKENHIAAAGGITAAVRKCRKFCQKQGRKWELEVEARTLADVEECLSAGVDYIMLDNMSLANMRRAVKLVAGQIPLEASGNVSLENVQAIAKTGVDFISIGALTHSAPAMDFSLLLK
jgi:nicotinate-nucleotide pyrophosphorylase (carboxylating)